MHRLPIALACSALLLGCGNSVKKEEPVRIGYLGIAAQLPLLVAAERGYFEAEGLTVEMTPFVSSNELGNAAAAGRVDVAAGVALNVMADIAVAGGQPSQLFLINGYSDKPGTITDRLLAKTGAGITSVDDLKHRKIATFPGSVRVLARIIFEKYNLLPADYTLVEMQPREWQPSLAAGAIDAVIALEPAATQIIADGVGLSILDGFYAKLIPELPLSGHWFSPTFVAQRDGRALSAIINAYAKALKDVEASPQGVRPLLAKLGVRENLTSSTELNPWTPADREDIEVVGRIRAYLDLLAQEGGINGKVDAASLVYGRR